MDTGPPKERDREAGDESFTREEYRALAAAAVRNRTGRVERLAGEVLDLPPVSPERAEALDRLSGLFLRLLSGQAVVSSQNLLILDERSEPQPDLALLRPPLERPDQGFYSEDLPVPADVLLLVEIVEGGGEHERGRKLPLYARAGIAEVWLLDLPAMTLEVYREPAGEGYGPALRFRGSEAVAPRAFPAVAVDLESLLG